MTMNTSMCIYGEPILGKPNLKALCRESLFECAIIRETT